MDPDDGFDGDEPLHPWLDPDDRLWRHPSEAVSPGSGSLALAARDPDRRLWAVAVLAGLVGALLASGAGVVTGGYHRTTTVIRPIEQVIDPNAPVVTPVSSPKDPIVGIAERLAPAIVELLVNDNGTDQTGSGVIFRSDGYVLTNAHVVSGGDAVAVMHDGRRVKCHFVGADPATDIAVLELPPKTTAAVATLGSAASLRVGEMALTVGFPLGVSRSPSIAGGIISSLGRNVDSALGLRLVDMIQTDSWVAPGISGGALVDARGMVVGITTAVPVGTQAGQGQPGQGFSTPIDIARDVAEQLVTSGKVMHVWLGVTGMDIDNTTADDLGVTGGAVIEGLDENGPAVRAGIEVNDIIIGFGDANIGSMSALAVAVRQHRPGQHLTISFIRNGRQRTADVVLAERPTSPAP